LALLLEAEFRFLAGWVVEMVIGEAFMKGMLSQYFSYLGSLSKSALPADNWPGIFAFVIICF
jgi:hypothetical protein